MCVCVCVFVRIVLINPNLKACFQRVVYVNKYASKDYEVIEYADSEYDIFINVIRIYLLFTCHEK